MKKWAFVSDFDGTISKKDFYHLVLENYFPEGRELYKQWKSGKLLDIDFLSQVFASIHQDEDALIEAIKLLPIDEHIRDFIKLVEKNGGDFYVLSAGTDYYIRHILNEIGAENVEIFSNEGYFHSRNVHLKIDKEDWKYSERYGIDKSKVIVKLKEEYETIYFFGDSEPDSHPAVYADVTFAKDALCELLEEKGIKYIGVNNFKDVEAYLREKGRLM
ncbi:MULTISPECIES: MtnX-like HAD-IB family phosphatase [Bacillaceae]|uniref:MtnX-like HAD-IB family phosphatase n=1 Tax=Bacillaceae TaxID=186817 RepID=UPI000C774094|nr:MULTISPECIES: MtnX-like HAD-IB family phosphatase [Bacillaceae]PLR66824.1 2,3-diketo-5-methylthio-1-phosphopentane phosphatase [Bacillus sp. UMB0893]QNG61503.1 MtnX-like HAD-IB family phosphatase [Bacillus sp. PAMC26568]